MVGERPDSAVIWASWHEAHLLALVCYPRLGWARPCHSFVPHGWRGAIARAWVEQVGMVPAQLPPTGNSAPKTLSELAGALSDGHDVVVAVDGPYGPAGRVRSGVFWLARLTGMPIVPVGIAARRFVRMPRWDRLQVPVPGSRVAIVIGEPVQLAPDERISARTQGALAGALRSLTTRAHVLVRTP